MEEYCGWTRDVDWGIAPSWAAVIVAVFVGAFTCANVVTARRSYVEGKLDAKVSQARRVYAHVLKQQTLPEGDRITSEPESPDHVHGRYYKIRKQDPASGQLFSMAREDLIRVHAEYVNGSDEPVGEVVVELVQPDGRVLETERPATPRVLSPNSKVTAILYAPFSFSTPPTPESMPTIRIRFRDSAGHRWSRDSTSVPVEEKRKRKGGTGGHGHET